ncbi:MAG: GNAT family N-acetyltransferase [Planctomycetes bacterium]|nr:GNAT family N-acetyltransferase [Planctomycetota bacterium]
MDIASRVLGCYTSEKGNHFVFEANFIRVIPFLSTTGMHRVSIHDGYDIVLFEAPLAASEIASLTRLLGHKGEPWLEDIRCRYAGHAADFCVVAIHRDEPVSHVWIGADAGYPAIALLGHVFTLPEHRRRGLARVLLRTALAHSDARASRLLALGVDNLAAALLYLGAGFRDLGPPDSHGHQVMVRGAAADDLLAGRWPVAGGVVRRSPLGPAWYASGVLLMNAFPGTNKLPSLGIVNGHEAELQLLECTHRAAVQGESVQVLVEDATGCLMGVEHVTGRGVFRYAVPGCALQGI